MPNLEMVVRLGAEVQRDCEFSRLGYDFSDSAGTLTFAVSSNHAARAVRNSNVVGIISTPDAAALVPDYLGLAITKDPRAVFYGLNDSLSRCQSRPRLAGVSPEADVDSRAYLQSDVEINEGASVGPFAVIESGVSIGPNCVVSAGAKIGIDGILFVGEDGARRRIKHHGSVMIGEGSILQPDCTIARAVLVGDATRLGDGVVVGAHAVVGHDVDIANSVVISSACVLARGVRVGSGAYLGSGVVVREYVTIGQGARVLAGSVVVGDVESGSTMSGNFAEDHMSRVRRQRRASKL